MPPSRRKAPASLTTARRSAEVDTLAPESAAEPAPHTAQGTTLEAAAVASAERTVPRRPTKTPRSINFDTEVLERLRAAVTHLAAYQPDAGVHSLADVVNKSVLTAVIEYEQKYNGGKEFPRVAAMPTGRPFKG